MRPDGAGRRRGASSRTARASSLCAAVVVLPPLVATARAQLGRGPMHVVAAVGLPFGAEGAKATARPCAQAVADGADVLDVVASLPLLANGDFPAARDELAGSGRRRRRRRSRRAGTSSCARSSRRVTCEPAAWRLAARLAASAGCDGVSLRDRPGARGRDARRHRARCAPSCPRAASSRRRAASARWPTRSARSTPARTCWASRTRPVCCPSSPRRQRAASPTGRIAAQSRAVSGHLIPATLCPAPEWRNW